MLACRQELARPIMDEALQPWIHTATPDPGVNAAASSAAASFVFVSPATYTRAPNGGMRGTSTAGGERRAAVARSRRTNGESLGGGVEVELVEHAIDIGTQRARNGATRGTDLSGTSTAGGGSRAAVARSRRTNGAGLGGSAELVEHALDIGTQRARNGTTRGASSAGGGSRAAVAGSRRRNGEGLGVGAEPVALDVGTQRSYWPTRNHH